MEIATVVVLSRSQTKEADRQCWQASASDCTGVLELRMTDEMQWPAESSRIEVLVEENCSSHQCINDVIFSLAQHPLPVLSGSNPDPNGRALPSCPHAETQTNNHPVRKMS